MDGTPKNVRLIRFSLASLNGQDRGSGADIGGLPALVGGTAAVGDAHLTGAAV